MSRPDTFERSMAHWSEAGRKEMEAFYAVATLDYRELAEAADWHDWLGDADTILDVACGSGKFPVALARYASLGEVPRTLDLLDPSAFSIAEAARSLELPFVAGAPFACRLQDLDPAAGPWPRVWATHALYAIPPADLDGALRRFLDAIAPGGRGFIAHARADSFYLSFHRAYLQSPHGAGGTPFSTAEDLLAALDRLGVTPEVRDIWYTGTLPAGARDAAQGFLQRCLFDESLSLEDMDHDPHLGPLVRAARGDDGGFRFPQHTAMIFLRR